jgi:hypothetical protein
MLMAQLVLLNKFNNNSHNHIIIIIIIIIIIKDNTEATLLRASRDGGLKINAETQNSGQNKNIKIANESFENSNTWGRH